MPERGKREIRVIAFVRKRLKPKNKILTNHLGLNEKEKKLQRVTMNTKVIKRS